MTSLALWSQLVGPNQLVELEVPQDIRITSVVFDEKLVDKKRATVKLHIVYQQEDEDEEDDEEEKPAASGKTEKDTLVLANLIPGVVEAQPLNLILTTGDNVIFEVTGKNAVYLSGNYIEQPPEQPPYDSEDEDEDDYEDEDDADIEAFNQLSEKEKDQFLESLMREQEAQAPKSKKRAAEATSGKPESKKLKGETGKAAPAPESKAEGKEKKEKKEKTKEAKGEEKSKVIDKKEDKPAKAGGKKFTTPGGVVVEDKVVGTGKAAKKGKNLKMRYILKLGNGKIVDKNTNGAPFKFRLGAGEVIKGWDEGLLGMQVGGERKLEVPAHMGYGKRKMSDIPANSTLYFEVKLLDTDA